MPAFKPNTHVQIGGNAVYVVAEDQQGNVVMAYGAVTPANTTPGFAPGAMFMNTTAKLVYVNAGTTDSSLFTAMPYGEAQAALTAENSSTIDGTYGAEEQAVLDNLRTRVGEIEAALNYWGILAGA